MESVIESPKKPGLNRVNWFEMSIAEKAAQNVSAATSYKINKTGQLNSPS